GVIQHVGAPKAVYDYPENIFVAGFIGSPAMNFFSGRIIENVFESGEIKLNIQEAEWKNLKKLDYINKEVILELRPDDIHDDSQFIRSAPDATIRAQVKVLELMGSETLIYFTLGNQEIAARVDSRNDLKINDTIELAIDMSKVHFFDKDAEKRIEC